MYTRKVWEEFRNELGQISFGMSSALGATLADLPTDILPGSDAFDYSTQKIYFFDGKEWK